MANSISLYFAKKSFLSARAEVYEQIESNFAETGSRRVATLREMFEAWAKRETVRKNSIALVYRAIVKRLDAGHSFAEALKPFIPREEALVLQAGEASGRLVEALASVRGQKEMDGQIRSAVTAAVSEPAMGILAIGLTSWFCGKSLWPEMLRVVEPKYWPDWAMPLIYAEISFAENWEYMAALVLTAILYLVSIPRWRGRIRSIFDRIPPWSIYRDRQAATLLCVLGGLLKSGMELDAALARVSRGSSPWLAWRVAQIKKRLSVAGASPVSALNCGLFAPGIMDLIEDAARNKSFDETLVHLGTRAMPLIVKRVRTMAIVVGTLLTLMTGVVFAYQIAVQQIATSQASNKLISAQGR